MDDVTACAALDTALFRATSSQRLWVNVSNSFSSCRYSEIFIVWFKNFYLSSGLIKPKCSEKLAFE